MCVVSLSARKVLLLPIRSVILESVHLCVMLVTDLLNGGIILSNIFPLAVCNFCSAVVYVNDDEFFGTVPKIN